MNKMRIIKSLICLFKKHELKDEPEFKCYIRDGRRFVYHGRIFRCKRCGAIVHIHGVMDTELKDLIETTLKDLPPGEFSHIFNDNKGYEFLDFYEKG
ncbi:hypothetical protein LCGC14_1779260 [marine sediment metagenome]|uniref:Uncharacterized protein n=1 Tax=marine sediment metagenome TaxID=412755 RepID=A0A0F9JVK6_9ZZZZ